MILTKKPKQDIDQLKYRLGEQTIIDHFSFSGLEELPDHLIIDGQFVRCLFVAGYPYVASSGWLDNLINFNRDIDISYHINEISALLALPKLHRKITELESTKRAMIKSGKIVSSEITDPLSSATELRDKILRGQEKLFQISIYIALRASSLEELNKATTLLESTLSSRLFSTKIARYEQLTAIQSILPRCTDNLGHKRNLDGSSAALIFPFMSSELVQPSGILYGINKSNDSLVIIDRFSLHNANSIVFAQSGSGKSYATKVEILRQLMQGTDIIVIDPEREYLKLADSVGGTSIKISVDSSEHINPFDLNIKDDRKQSVYEHTQDLTDVISLMVDGLSSTERAAVDKAIILTYKEKKTGQPTLNDFYESILNLGEKGIANRLDKYVSGSLKGVFSSNTNINLENRLVVFDIKDLPDSLREIMMMIISNYVEHRVKSTVKKRLLVIDEGWILLEHEQSARFVSGLVRRARKYWLGVAIISQQANDFLLNDYGRAIASQSALRILMRQDTTTIKNVVSEFNLSEYEQSYLLTCDRGEALIIADQNHVALSVVASQEEHPLITTDPNELYRTS